MSDTTAVPSFDHRAVMGDWVAAFDCALSTGDTRAVAGLLGADPWWRDLYALRWDISTLRGAVDICEFLDERLAASGFREVRLDDRHAVSFPEETYIEAVINFTTRVGTRSGVVRLLSDKSGAWRAWTISTSLQELTDRPFQQVKISDIEQDAATASAMSAEGEARHAAGGSRGRAQADDLNPSVLIIGAGHCGLFLAAHLKRLGITTLLVDRNKQVGDNWRHRYHGLVLHEPKWSAQFPYMSFPETWPLLPNKDMIADWMEAYARFLDLRVWTAAEVTEAVYDTVSGSWTVVVDRGRQRCVLSTKQLVFATGNHGVPQLPDIAGAADFTGTMTHSSEHQGGPSLRGLDVVVVGSGSSALDVAQDACDQGAHVTLVQRGPTHVVSQRAAIPAFHGAYYGESGPSIEEADLMATSMPTRLTFELIPHLTRSLAEADSELLFGLEEAGFATTLGPDDLGIMYMTFVRAGGYYLDRGGAQLIIGGRIAVRRAQIERLTATEVVFEDGMRVHADMVVCCTGYTNMRDAARPILGDEVTERLATVWGLDDSGELRTAFRHCGHDRLWFLAGGFRDARIYSRYVALAITAVEAGIVDSASLAAASATTVKG
ncbi:NAD(P)/FAD-dependent oxidoreductase [Streptomyces sp. PT12]|uniref:flavin-containing monooxygenase n=1 Tax=Streptomyces sp. PT12 TaxID=1510197 RepID=UPI000DE35E16|nr:NAD(P)/FAD-dependent oxidoreductase [Streptomyces sp. PT12]RBM19620.1 NAD(P)/FAD-dependent oxidoreductase [Streptomyces sp. PT12]